MFDLLRRKGFRVSEPRTETNLAEQTARSYLKGAAQEAFAARQCEVGNSAYLKQVVKKLRSSNVGTATITPRSTEITEVTDETFEATTKTAYEQLKEIAPAQSGQQQAH